MEALENLVTIKALNREPPMLKELIALANELLDRVKALGVIQKKPDL